MISPQLGKAVNTQMFGKSGSMLFCHINNFTRELYWLQVFHIEDGIPSRLWLLGRAPSLTDRYDEEDNMLNEGVARGEHATRDELSSYPPNMDAIKYCGNGKVDEGTKYERKVLTGGTIEEANEIMERRLFATGIKIK